MRTYHGERTEAGCEVTVDGWPLRMRSDLSGSATTAYDWGYAGAGQLSLALLADFLRNDDRRAKALAPAFENVVVANLAHDSWTLTDDDLAAAVAPLASSGAGGRDGGGDGGGDAGAAFGDMPIRTADLVRPAPPPRPADRPLADPGVSGPTPAGISRGALVMLQDLQERSAHSGGSGGGRIGLDPKPLMRGLRI